MWNSTRPPVKCKSKAYPKGLLLCRPKYSQSQRICVFVDESVPVRYTENDEHVRLYLTINQLVEDLDAVEALYGRCDDVSMFNSDGVTKITFHRDAASLDDAIRTAVSDVQSAGYKVKHIEVEPECVGAE